MGSKPEASDFVFLWYHRYEAAQAEIARLEEQAAVDNQEKISAVAYIERLKAELKQANAVVEAARKLVADETMADDAGGCCVDWFDLEKALAALETDDAQ